jgi:hypothetical protein
MASVKLVTLVLSVVALPGCLSTHAPATPQASLHALAPEIVNAWAANRAVLDHIARGGPFDVQEYMRAVALFEQVTGIQAHDMQSFGGRYPDEHLEEDLLAWDSWREANASCLRWNAVQGVIECDRTKRSS